MEKFEIKVQKLTDETLIQKACAVTAGKKESKIKAKTIYRNEHSPMRTQIFWVEMINIPTFVSVHLVRHKIGVEHFVQSSRPDISKKDFVADRFTPINHSMIINAEALITMSRKRLCTKASSETRDVMNDIRDAVEIVDPDLAEFMVPNCLYRSGCYETKPCGFYKVYINNSW